MAERADYVEVLKALGLKVAAKSGQPGDRYHVGKLLIEALKATGDVISQTDGGTGESESAISSLERSVRCAAVFRALGLVKGDVIIISGPTHLDVAPPIYAAMFLGLIVMAENYKVDDEKAIATMELDFKKLEPKLIVCESVIAEIAVKVGRTTSQNLKVISFTESEHAENLKHLMDTLGKDANVDSFEPANFCPEQTIAIIAKSSGTTGVHKVASISHRSFILGGPTLHSFRKHPDPEGLYLLLSGLSWVTSILTYIVAPLLGFPRLHTSKPVTIKHFSELCNKYRPTHSCISPPFFTHVLQSAKDGDVDLSSLETVLVAGCPVSPTFFVETKKVAPNIKIILGYGMTEASSLLMMAQAPADMAMTPLKNVDIQFKLVNTDTGATMTGSNISGELFVKSSFLFKGYYKNPELTQQMMTEDGWIKTGDMFKRNVEGNYIFVERVKFVLKYYYPHVLERYYIMVSAVEQTIRCHPSVLDVAVTGVPEPTCGDLAVACVVLRAGCTACAQDIKDFVQNKMEDHNRLRGGVIFLENLPMTASMKVDRMKLKEIALTQKKE